MITLFLIVSLLRPQAGCTELKQALKQEMTIFDILENEMLGIRVLMNMIVFEKHGIPNWVEDKHFLIAGHLRVIQDTIHSCKNKDLKMFLEDTVINKIVPFYGYLLKNGKATKRVDKAFRGLMKAVEFASRKWKMSRVPFRDTEKLKPGNTNSLFDQAA